MLFCQHRLVVLIGKKIREETVFGAAFLFFEVQNIDLEGGKEEHT